MPVRSLTALPVYNEVRFVDDVIDEVCRYASEVLVVDDGSTDGTSELLAARNDINLVAHPENRGYGAGLISAFQFAIENEFDCVVTIDCDGQHEPQRIPDFIGACHGVDIVSGSRYLTSFAGDNEPPAARRRINEQITAQVNRRLGVSLTDAFCGFKAYRVASLKQLRLTEPGYAMPLELWVQAAALGMTIVELPVPLIYLDEERSFGGALDDSATRLDHYYEVLERSMRTAEASACLERSTSTVPQRDTDLEARPTGIPG